MSKTIVYISMTLDGFVAGKNDDLSWLMPYSTVNYGYKEFYDTIGAIILGKRTYDHIIGNWGWPYADIPAFILSNSLLKNVPRGTEVNTVQGDIADVLEAAKSKTNKDIWVGGGAHVVQEFLNQGLVDELIITIVPVLLGEGIRLFDSLTSQSLLEHYDTKTYDKGLVQLSYRVSVE
jgi:dihydrofolate reductase